MMEVIDVALLSFLQVNGLTSTRSLLELVIRREALADRGGSDGRAPLTFVKHYVKGLLFEDGNRTVTGSASHLSTSQRLHAS